VRVMFVKYVEGLQGLWAIRVTEMEERIDVLSVQDLSVLP